MKSHRDPLEDPGPLIRRVYSYVAYRIGGGPDAEDVTSATIERALRYRASYDPARGKPVTWLLGIARTCVDDHLRGQRAAGEPVATDEPDTRTAGLEEETVLRLDLARALEILDERDRELIALRYGADLGSKEIGRLLDMSAGAVDVAVHRCKQRLRLALTGGSDLAKGIGATPARGSHSHAV